MIRTVNSSGIILSLFQRVLDWFQGHRGALVLMILLCCSVVSYGQYIVASSTNLCANQSGTYQFFRSGKTFLDWSFSNGGAGFIADPTSEITSVTWTSSGDLVARYRQPPFNIISTERVFVTVRPNPAAVSFTNVTSPVCVNSSGNGYNVSPTPYTYEWSLPSGGGNIDANVGNAALVSWSSVGTYGVSVRVNNNGCWSGYSSATVNVLPTPTSFSLSGNSVCSGAATGVITMAGSESDVTYKLKGSSDYIQSGTGGAMSWSNLVAGNYTMSGVRNTNGCPQTFLGSVTITSQSGPSALSLSTVNPTCSSTFDGQITITNTDVDMRYDLSNGLTFKGNGGSMSWPGLGAGSYTITASRNQCKFGIVGSVTLASAGGPPPSFETYTDPACAFSTGNVYTTQSGMSNYSWTVSQGGTVTSGGTSGSNSVTVTWNNSGNESVSVNYTDGNGCTASSATVKEVKVKPLASPITDVIGLKVNFKGETIRLHVRGSDDATSFNWVGQSGITFTNTSNTGVPGREVLVKLEKGGGSYVLQVKAVRDGCELAPFDVPITILGIAMQNQVVTMDEPALNSLSEGFLYLNKHSSNYNGCIGEYGPVTVSAGLDFGDTYNLGERNFTIAASVTITAYYDLPGQEESWTVPYVLNSNAPEQLFRKVLPLNPYLLKFIKVKVNSYSTTDAVAGGLVRLVASYEEQDKTLNTATISLTAVNVDAGKWEQLFSWTPSCADVENYELQLLHLTGNQAADWNQALSLQVDKSTSYSLALAEGSGDYRWRVRAIGNLEGGINNPANHGPWSAESPITDYVHPEEDQNWIYSRTFTEGNRVSEQLTYANGLQQIAQQQTRIQGDNQIVATQTLQDFTGRSALSSLPVPVTGSNKNHLGYVEGLLKNGGTPVKTSDFDTDPYTTPLLTDQSNYYSGTDNGLNAGVASAEGYPYTRTLFTEDGTGRVKEQGGVGATHAVKEGGKTVKTFYANPNESELLMLFGKEAPQVTSVQKITTLDANGTASISYQTKDGKVIATALAVNPAVGPLSALASQAAATRTVFEEVKGSYRSNERTVVSRKPLLFTSATDIEVAYQLNPSQLKELCGGGQDASLVAYYPLDGSGEDRSGNGNTAAINGAVVVSDRFSGQAYLLDGEDDYLQASDGPQFQFGSDDFTVSMWVRKMANSVGGDNNLGVSKWDTGVPGANEWVLSLGSMPNNSIPGFFIESGTATYSTAASTSLALNTWFHVVGERVGNQLKIYVNGVLEGVTSIPAGVVINNKGIPLQIGRQLSGYYTAAAFDEIQLYRRALSDQEVNVLYQRGGTLCKTCDYTVEFKLYKQDDLSYVHPGLPAPYLIRAGECSEQSALSWNPAPFTLSRLYGGVNYVLEKSIRINNTNPSTGQLYIDEHTTQIRDNYTTQLTSALTTINNYITTHDMSGLYVYLDGQVVSGKATYNAQSNQYMVLLGSGTTGCPDYVFIPKMELCDDETVNAADCTQGATHQTFEYYAQAELAEQAQQEGTVFNPLINIGGTDYLSYVYFTNKYDHNKKQYFLPGQFNTMMSNLLAANGGDNGLLNCDLMWKVWREEVEGYTARGKIDLSGDDLTDYAIVVGENNLLDNFFTNLDGRLQALMTTQDICTQSGVKNYFIKKDKVYGFIGGGVTTAGTDTDDAMNVDVTQLYRLIYVDDRIFEMANALRGLSGAPATTPPTPPTLSMFTGLTVCQKYQLYQATRMSNFTTTSGEDAKQKALLKMRSRCGISCESRREEFLQAIIHNIISNAPTAKLQYYSVSMAINNKYIGVRDMNVNTTVFDYSDCELTAMVDALIQNCKENYCQTTLSLNPNGTLGTTAEWDKIHKAVAYDFEVQVKQNGQSCDPTFDWIHAGVVELDQPWKSAKILATGKSGYWNLYKDVGFYLEGMIEPTTSLSIGNNIFINGNNSADYFTSRFDVDGNFLWANHMQTNAYSGLPSQFTNHVGTSGGLLNITDIRSETAGTDVEENGARLRSLAPNTGVRFLSKRSLTGQLEWSTDVSNEQIVYDAFYNTQHGVKISKDNNGNTYTLRVLSSSVTEGGGHRVSVIKRDINGNVLWESPSFKHTPISSVSLTGGQYEANNSGPHIDGSGNIYFTISTNYYNNLVSTITGWTLSQNNNVIESVPVDRPKAGLTTIVKLNSLGGFEWSRNIKKDGLIFQSGLYYYNYTVHTLENSILIAYDLGMGDVEGVESEDNSTNFILIEYDGSGTLIRKRAYTFPFSRTIWVGGGFYFDSEYLYYTVKFGGNPILYFGSQYLFRIDRVTNQTSSMKIDGIGLEYSDLRYLYKEGDYFYIGFNYPRVGAESKSETLSIGNLTIAPVANQVNFVLGKYDAQWGKCEYRPLCFRFTVPTSTTPNTVVVPEGMEDYVFNPKEETCEEASSGIIKASLEQQQAQLISKRVADFKDQYVSKCADPALIDDKLTISYQLGLHHFTLYYYDRAGNLMKTVPPAGVSLLRVDNSLMVTLARQAVNAHTLVTEYQYNSLGQLVRDHSPDGNADPGLSSSDQNTYYTRPLSSSAEQQLNATRYYATYLYNAKGQLRFSRNAKQKQSAEGSYSYTKYDNLGRIMEVGESTGYKEEEAKQNRNNNSTYPSANLRQVTGTYYTSVFDPNQLPAGYTQRYLRNRVSYSYLDEDGSEATREDRIHTVYSYDPHGNVEWVLQLIPGLPATGIKYQYDLISGKVLQVDYNPGKADQFIHRYDYDANNRITKVSTSKDGQLWEQDASYEYYTHGPLKRTVIGEDQVQGMDYTYTVHGWLKALNHPLLDKDSDPNKDGDANSAVGRDAFGMALTYFSGDYKRTSSPLETTAAGSLLPEAGKELYNGNISAWTSNMFYGNSVNSAYANAGVAYKQLTGYQYRYDELNRLEYGTFMTYGGNGFSIPSNYSLASQYSYDANGNIRTQNNVSQAGGVLLDNTSYNYYPSTNRLRHISEQAAPSAFGDDIENQNADNYVYDAIGNLTRDVQQQTQISWTPYGKVKRVDKVNSSGSPTGAYTEFSYDAQGKRVTKKQVNTAGLAKTNYYVHDASGNTMAVYEKIEESTGSTPAETNLIEMYLYGSDRIGVYNEPVRIDATATAPALETGEVRIAENTTRNVYDGANYLLNTGVRLTLGAGFNYTATNTDNFVVRVGESGGLITPADGVYTRTLNRRQYELKDHLGNVRVVVNDQKLSKVTNGIPGSYEGKIISMANYYAFGMDQPGRSWSAESKYRYGFNGQEKDGNGEFGGSQYAFTYRMYNPSIGRFLTVDPLAPKYPHNSPYAFAENKLGLGKELEGLELSYFNAGPAVAYHYTYGKGDGDIGLGDILGGFGYAMLTDFTPAGTYIKGGNTIINYVQNEGDHYFNSGHQYQKAIVNQESPDAIATNYEFNKTKGKIELVGVAMEWSEWSLGGAIGALEGAALTVPLKTIRPHPSYLNPKRVPFGKPVSEWGVNSVFEKKFNHAMSNHGVDQFGLKWGKKASWQTAVDAFNDIAVHIREQGNYMGVEHDILFNGKKTSAHVYRYYTGNEAWYYWETLNGEFISAGKDTLGKYGK